MSSTSLVRSGYPRDWDGPGDRRRGGGSSGGFSRFVIAVGLGVGGTLAWQSYGDQAREMIAGAYPQLGWLSPRVANAQTASAAVPVKSTDQQLQELSLGVIAMRQRVEQLSMQVSASQDQLTRELTAKVQTAERDILDKIAAGQRPEASAPRRPAMTQNNQSQLR